jgi:hypothetical protein
LIRANWGARLRAMRDRTSIQILNVISKSRDHHFCDSQNAAARHT